MQTFWWTYDATYDKCESRSVSMQMLQMFCHLFSCGPRGECWVSSSYSETPRDEENTTEGWDGKTKNCYTSISVSGLYIHIIVQMYIPEGHWSGAGLLSSNDIFCRVLRCFMVLVENGNFVECIHFGANIVGTCWRGKNFVSLSCSLSKVKFVEISGISVW